MRVNSRKIENIMKEEGMGLVNSSSNLAGQWRKFLGGSWAAAKEQAVWMGAEIQRQLGDVSGKKEIGLQVKIFV